MSELQFKDFDKNLLDKKGKIIHYISFEEYKNNFEECQDNREYTTVIWNKYRCFQLVTKIYPEHLNFLKNKNDECKEKIVKFLILHRYGGIYIDINYQYEKINFSNEVYFNNEECKVKDNYISTPSNHPFFRRLLIDIEIADTYNENILNESFNENKDRFKLNTLHKINSYHNKSEKYLI